MRARVAAVVAVVAMTGAWLAAQTIHQAPATAPSTGRVTPANEPGAPMHVSGTVVGPDGASVAGASLYIYQTDHEGYYGVKPASDNRNPRLKLFLRSDAKGEFAFDTVRPGQYPNAQIPAHIHFEVSAKGFADKVFEIVFEGDKFITADMRKNAAFSVRQVTANGGLTQVITLSR